MKTVIVTLTLCVFVISGFAQSTTSKTRGSDSDITISVPNFADPATKQFYESYTYYIKKAVLAIRNKDEAAWKSLIEEGKRLDNKSEQMSRIKSTPEDIKKKHAWNKQATPYLQEIIQSDFNKKLEKEQGSNK